MQTKSNYNIHTQYASFIEPKSTKTTPNSTLRKFILDWVKDGKPVSPTQISRAYNEKTGETVSYQRVQNLIIKLGAKSISKLRKTLLVFLIMASLAAAQLSLGPAVELSLQIPQIKQWVYPSTAYASDSAPVKVKTLEGVVESSSIPATAISHQATPSASYKLGKVTAYSCGGLTTQAEIDMNCPSLRKYPKGRTASGTTPRPNITVACDRAYMGQKFVIDGIGEVTCEDTGGAIKGEGRFDLYVETVDEAYKFGVQKRLYRSK